MLEYKNIKCTVKYMLNLADCPHIHRIICHLKKFNEHAFAVDAGNVTEFDLSAIILSFAHLVTVHNLFSIKNRPLIREHISHRIGCNAGPECQVLQNHAQRKREGNEVQNRNCNKKTKVNAVRSLCKVTSGVLCSAHCYILHSENELYRVSGASNKFESRFSTPVVTMKEDEEKDVDDVKTDA